MKLLVVVDMQNDFISGALGTKEAEKIVDRVVNKINNHDGEVLVTMDTHNKDYLNTQEGQNLPVEHCVLGTDGWNLNDKVNQALLVRDGGYIEARKNTFGAKEIEELIRVAERKADDYTEEIELIGLCTDICVISNALLIKAFYPEVPIKVDSSCCAGATPEGHNIALDAMKMCQIEVI